MDDRAPILKPSSPAPPSYVQAASTATTKLNNHTVAGHDQVEAPPPYTSSTSSYSYGVPNLGPNYQRFDIITDNQVEMMALCHLGPDPCQTRCPICGQFVTTVTHHKAGTLTFISATLCFLFCVVCTFLPFCVNDFQDVEHRCPSCNYCFGTYTRV